MINFKSFISITAFLISFIFYGQDISESTARKVANNFLKIKLNHELKKSNENLKITNITHQINKEYNGFYIFTIKNGNGFCIVSSESANHPILAYSTNSTIPASTNCSPGFLNILNSFEYYNNNLRKKIQKRSFDKKNELIKKEWEALLNDQQLPNSQEISNKALSKSFNNPLTVDPLIKTIWDQSPLYNKFTPNTYENVPTYAGSASIAMAQIMKFWNFPTNGSDSMTYFIPNKYYYYNYDWKWKKLSANFQNTTYLWDKMPVYLSKNSSAEQIDAVAKLISHAGISIKTMYGPIGSGAFSTNVPQALKKYFKYSPDIQLIDRTDFESDDEWLNVFKSQVSKGLPVYLSGQYPDAEHAYIVDGYDSQNLIHLNFGWGGTSNGYYWIDELRGYSSSQIAIINIYPSTYSSNLNCEIPSGFSSSDITFQSATLNWNANQNLNYTIQIKADTDNDWTIVGNDIRGSSYTLSNLSPNTSYTARIKSNCDNGKSSNFTEVNFNTTSHSSPSLASCINNFEPNDTFDDAYLIKPDSVYYAGIQSHGDKDYFKFFISKNSDIVIRLQKLPKDYDIKLFNSGKFEIGQSEAANTTDEKILIKNVLPGTYYIEVYGYKEAFDESQCYELEIHATTSIPSCSNNYEPNNSFEEAYPIDTHTTYFASIATARDQDYYTFTLDSDSNINIILQDIYYDYDFNLYDSSKNLIERGKLDSPNSKLISVKNLAAGKYYIHITGKYHPTSCYSLTIDTVIDKYSCNFNYEVNDTFESAVEIKTDYPYTASIGFAHDQDYYKFTLDKKSNVNVVLQNIGEKYELKLYNSNKTEIGSKYNEDQSDEIININDLEPGTYYILIQGINGAFNNSKCYSLFVETNLSIPPCINNFEPNDTFQEATSIELNTKYDAGIGSSNDKDYYKFILNETSDIKILLQNLPKNYDLILYDNFNYEIDRSINIGNISEKIEIESLPAGTYYIYIYGKDGVFDTSQCYNLEVITSSVCASNYEPNNSIDMAYPIRNILTYSSDISSPTDDDYYKIFIGVKADIEVVLDNLPENYDLKLYNSSKQEIGRSSNSGTNKEVINVYNVERGVYYVYVYGSNGAFAPGKCYDLTVNFKPTNTTHPIPSCVGNFEPNNTFEEAFLINTNTKYEAAIGTHNDLDYYKFNLSEKGDILVKLDNLTKNYDIKIYNSLKEEIGSSLNIGDAKEEINILNLDKGIYYVYIYGKDGEFDPTSCYNLIVNFYPLKNNPDISNNEDSIILYPNPVHDVLNIKGINKDKEKFTTFTILDSSGRIVKNLQTKVDDIIPINVSDLSPNQYYLQIQGRNFRFIKN